MTRGLISLSNQEFGFTGNRDIRDPKPPRGEIPWFNPNVTVRKVDENSTAISVNNDSSETTIATMTLPALILASTGAARLTAYGTVNKDTGGGETVTFRLKLADQSSTSTVLATAGINAGNSTDTHAWYLESMFLGKQPNINRVGGIFDMSVAGGGAELLASTFSAIGFSTLGLDEADEWTVSITAQMSAASASFTVTREFAVLEGVN